MNQDETNVPKIRAKALELVVAMVLAKALNSCYPACNPKRVVREPHNTKVTVRNMNVKEGTVC